MNDQNYTKWKGWQESNFGTFSTRQSEYFKAELSLSKEILPQATILEIGFGNGGFLGWCRKNYKHSNIIGIETNKELLQRAEMGGIRVYESVFSEKIDSLHESIDLIIAFDVIEHIDGNEIIDFFKRISHLLKSDGVFIFRVPNGDSPFGQPYQNGDLTHKTSIGRNKVKQLANECGLEIRRLASPAKSTTKITSAGRYLFERLVAYLYFEGARYNFAPNIVVTLAKNGIAH